MGSASSIRQSGALDFGRTRWSMVLAVQRGESEARRSLAELCQRYWVPCYAYVRGCGHAPEAAAARVRSFLGHLVQEIRDGDPAGDGGFRIFLQRRLERFLAGDPRGMDANPPAHAFDPPRPLDQIEQRLPPLHAGVSTPADSFQRAFALELLDAGLAQLRDEARQAGREDMYEAVRPYLAREPAAGEYPALALRLRTSPLAVVIAVKRLRQRYQELIDAQLVQTVGSAEALAAERVALLALLETRAT